MFYIPSDIFFYLVYFTILQLSMVKNDMMVSALTTPTPQNNTLSNTSIIPQITVQNVLSTSFGTSYNTEVKDNSLSTNTAPTSESSSLSFEMPYDLQFKEEETFTQVVQNSTSSTYLAFRYFFNESKAIGMKHTRSKHILLQNKRFLFNHCPSY